jgi:hypothetical protein
MEASDAVTSVLDIGVLPTADAVRDRLVGE